MSKEQDCNTTELKIEVEDGEILVESADPDLICELCDEKCTVDNRKLSCGINWCG